MTFRSEIVFVKIILPLILGIVIGYYFPSEQLLRVAKLALATTLSTAIFLNVLYKNLRLWSYKNYLASFCYFIFATFGLYLCLAHNQSLQNDYFAKDNYRQLKFVVNNEPQQTGDILRFEAKVNTAYHNNHAIAVSGKLIIALKLDSLHPIVLKYGDELMATADYKAVEPPYNPNEFNFKAWLASKNNYHQAFIKQNQLIKTDTNKGNSVVDYALTVRQQQVATYRKLIKNDEAFAVASTLILGYRADLSQETLSAYSKTGTIHALSVSGMHVGIIYIFLNWLLSFLERWRLGKVSKLTLIIVLIWYYSLLTGFSPSVLRSAIMLTSFIIAKSLKRSTNSYNIICFTAFCLLAYDPFLLWDVGFQLSFLAVLGLIYLQPKIYRSLYFKNIVVDKIWATIAMSLAAQIATIPLSVYYFHQFPIYFIISNLFIVLPIAVLMYSGIAILLLKLYFLAPFFEWLLNFTTEGLKWIAQLPYASITEIWLNFSQLLLLSLGLLLLCIALANYHKRLLFVSLFCFTALQLSTAHQIYTDTRQKEMIFFTLRKNYAALFTDGNQGVLLTDLSPSDKNYQFFIKPCIDQKNIKILNLVKWNQDFKNDFFLKSNHQINYHNKTLLLLDQSFNRKKIAGSLNFDYVWLHENPKINLNYLAKNVIFNHVIIDASNKDYQIANFNNQALQIAKTPKILKKQPATIVKIN